MGKNRKKLEREERELARRGPKRQPYNRVLIVCEGEKTETQYLKDIGRSFNATSANIQVLNAPGTAPIQVVNHAEAVFLRARAFDRIYAVFDRDDHDSYGPALTRAERLNGTLKNDEGADAPFIATPSVPCFELWLMLHFESVTAVIERKKLFKELKRYIPRYDKGMKDVFKRTAELIPDATKRAKNLQKEFSPTSGDPYTTMDILVADLTTLTTKRAT